MKRLELIDVAIIFCGLIAVLGGVSAILIAIDLWGYHLALIPK